MIPKALQTIKQATGENWPVVKRYLNWHLDWKRKLSNSGLSKFDKSFIFLSIIKDKVFNGQTEYKQAELPEEGIESRVKNVISTISKIDYDSEMVCYINDSYNKSPKSGNKKYPFLKSEK